MQCVLVVAAALGCWVIEFHLLSRWFLAAVARAGSQLK